MPQPMQPLTSRPIGIRGPAGELEALVDEPAGAVRAAAVICHPHPQHQGTMHHKVVHTLARTFRNLGTAAVRFNFRGVGASAGAYAGGDGEREDALAVAAWCSERWPAAQLLLAGFSFGAAVALAIAERAQARALVTVGLAFERAGDISPPRCPWLAVHGGRDEIVPTAALQAWIGGLTVRPEVAIIDGADHFFHGELPALAERVGGFVSPHLRDLGSASSDAAEAR